MRSPACFFSSLNLWQSVLVAIVAGAASVMAMAPFFAWPIMFFTFSIMIWLLDGVYLQSQNYFGGKLLKQRIFQSALIGWGFGFGYFLVSTYWIGYAFLVDADRYALLMPFAVAAFPAGLALFYAGASALASTLWQQGYARIAGFIFAFYLAEITRSNLLTGFPWNLFGQAFASSPALMQMASYLGIYGLTLAALFTFTMPAALLNIRKFESKANFRPFYMIFIFLSIGYILGHERLKRDPGQFEDVKIRVVQPNIPQKDKWNRANWDFIIQTIFSLSQFGTTGEDISQFSYVLWPESSFPYLFDFDGRITDKSTEEKLQALVPFQTSLLIGADRAEGVTKVENKYFYRKVFNSLFMIGQSAQLQGRYDKVHLVPFGEYLPFSNVLSALGLNALSHNLSGFSFGKNPKATLAAPGKPSFSPLICYEIIFSGKIVNQKNRPQFLVNLTNDAWFGTSLGPYQHLQQAQLRAVEEGLPVLRSANTGVSAIIDVYGNIISRLQLNERGVIDYRLPKSIHQTLYAKYRLPIFIVLFLFSLLFYLMTAQANQRR